MKRKEINIISETDFAELKKQGIELKKKLAQLAVSRYTNQSKNIRERKELRRKIAIILTVQKQKENAHGKK